MCLVATVVYHPEQPYSLAAFRGLLVLPDPMYYWAVDLSYLDHKFQDPSDPYLVLVVDSFSGSWGSFRADLREETELDTFDRKHGSVNVCSNAMLMLSANYNLVD